MDHNMCDVTALGVDEACINVESQLQQRTWLYALQSNCHECPLSLLGNVSAGGELKIPLSTHHHWTFRVTDSYSGQYLSTSNSSSTLCQIAWRLGQYGNYEMKVHESQSGDVECTSAVLQHPVNIYLPLTLAISVLVIVGLIYKLSCIAVRRIYRRKDVSLETVGAMPNKPDDGKAKKRVASLDAFRGISILLMIFVNDGAGGYSVLEHADWNGLKLADVLFPWFLWIMGVCIPISVKSQIKRNVSRLVMLKTILKRSIILFALGVMLSTLGVGPQLETLRIFGVLQRFGVLYLVVAGSCALLWPENTADQGTSPLRDVTVLLPQWLLHLALHAAHLIIIFVLPVPDCPAGYLGPGGRSQDGQYYNCTGGATGYIDRLILGEEHLYQYPTSKLVYGSGPFDPEGPYGCLPSLLTVMLGVQAGATLLAFPAWKARARRWAVWGFVCLALAAPLFITDAIPLNKNLWSTSFSLVTSGLAFLLLTLCYVLIDVWGCWEGSPFVYPGMNATIMYVGHMVAYQLWPFHWRIGSMDSHAWLLVEALWGVAAWTLVAYRLYQNKFFLSI